MNIISSFFNRFNKANSYLNFLFNTKGADWISVTGEESLLYSQIPQLKSVIDRRASMLSNGRWKHYDKNGEEIEDSPVVKFLSKPNPMQSGEEWLMQMEVQLSLYGNSFTYKLTGSSLAETPKIINNLPPRFMEINRTGKIWKQTELEEIISKFTLQYPNEKPQHFEPEEIMHMNKMNPDDPVKGLSPLLALQMPLSNIKASYEYRNVIMTKKGAIGILSNQNKDGVGAMPLKSDEKKRIEKQYQQDYGMKDGQSKIIVTDSSLNWQPMSYPTRELELFKEIDANMMAIIDAYGMDVNIFSSEKGTTFSNLYEGIKGCYENTIIPDANSKAKAMSYFLGLKEKGEYLKLTYDHMPILQKDKSKEAETLTKRVEAYTKLMESGWSKEELNNLFPIEDLIEFL